MSRLNTTPGLCLLYTQLHCATAKATQTFVILYLKSSGYACAFQNEAHKSTDSFLVFWRATETSSPCQVDVDILKLFVCRLVIALKAQMRVQASFNGRR